MMSAMVEHPAFVRAKALAEPLRSHFPKSSEEAQNWEPVQRIRTLASRVLVVAQTRIVCQWAAYVDAVPGQNHDLEWEAVLSHGCKMREDVARVLFPEFKDVDYAS